MTWLIVQLLSLSKMILNYRDLLDRLQSMINTRHDNNMTNHIGVIYVRNDTELSWLIGSGVDCDKNQIRQQRDWWYRYSLHQKQN